MNRFILIIFSITCVLGACEKNILGPAAENTPQENFKVLWTLLDEKYGLFPVRKANWDSLYTMYSGQIDNSTTENELWTICGNLITHLNDGHITLFNRNYTNWLGSSTLDPSKKEGFSRELVKSKYLQNISVSGEGYITSGKLVNSNIAYLYISSFNPVPNGRDWIKDIDPIIKKLPDYDATIIDLRNNGGGFAKNDRYFSSSFIDRELTYYYSQVKTGTGHSDFGPRTAKIISPRKDNVIYKGKIVLLTNRFTASGGEIVALIFKNLAYSTQIGDTTMGCFGEVTQVGQMPNGWTINFPCTLTTYEDGTSPEGIGIIPDIVIDNTKQDIAAGKDKVLERAIKFLVEGN